ncbi:gamma-glutamyl-gamma-aminobutyrate hydrolase family protein [Cryobacterium sp. M23]|uniref:gamma-glutamyl-gamma-aminobutyrate hydrolase family protein n=1 Tax=Cryobacterium sp. M23 TaxID=2048292 RepID=UPI0018ECB092|nr:gamma-glutamyl-gamma-aminobutyrate hydrolase family protein [Cryobacterium sp. M23]
MSASDPGTSPRPGADPRPVIGLTTYLEQSQTGVWDVPAAFLPQAYFDSVIRAGGIAVLLPPQPVDAAIADRVLDGLDGLVITGGKDVDPARYGQAAHTKTDEPRRDRDAWEHELIHRAIDRELPLLGICRGAQMLNIAQGGTLHQHLPDVVGHGGYQAGGGVFNIVDVHVEPESRLHGLLDALDVPLPVPVYHHQSIDRIGAGLTVSARTHDGVVQAVELTDVPFGLAVQWHPEQHDDLRLFAGLVDAAARYRATHEHEHDHDQERDTL